jgi:hypothetical protein
MGQREMNESPRLQELYARRVASGGAEAGAHASPEAILAVVRREGPEPERLATLEHVMACTTCHRDYEWLTAVDQAGEEWEGAAGGGVSPQATPWWQGRRLALAASLLLAVGAALAVASVVRPGPERERGGSSDIVLLSPGERGAVVGPVHFAWRAVPGGIRYVLEIQRPDGSVAISDTTADTVATVERGRLSEGTTYRWWVREVTDGAEPRSSAFRQLRIGAR